LHFDWLEKGAERCGSTQLDHRHAYYQYDDPTLRSSLQLSLPKRRLPSKLSSDVFIKTLLSILMLLKDLRYPCATISTCSDVRDLKAVRSLHNHFFIQRNTPLRWLTLVLGPLLPSYPIIILSWNCVDQHGRVHLHYRLGRC
jgi:hypothetical protein